VDWEAAKKDAIKIINAAMDLGLAKGGNQKGGGLYI